MNVERVWNVIYATLTMGQSLPTCEWSPVKAKSKEEAMAFILEKESKKYVRFLLIEE